MNTIIEKIKKNTFLTVITALFLGSFVFVTSSYLSKFTTPFLEEFLTIDFFVKGTIFKVYILILSIAMIWIVNKRSFKGYGFVHAKNIKYSRMFLISTGILIASMIVGGILFGGIIRNYFPTDNDQVFPNQSILQMILTVWIWSSFTEEILSRGLVQGFMNHLKDKKFLGLSISVIVSGLFFGSLHLGLLKGGMAYWFVGMIVTNATVVGLLAAYYREKSDSVLPAIYIHILSNVVGSIPFFIMMALDIKPTM